MLTKVTQDSIKSSLIPTGFKNKIIGGDFSLNPWQRGTSFSAVANGAYTADRFYYIKAGSGVNLISKDTDVPSSTNAYTQHSFGVNVTTADLSIAASDLYAIGQKIEGYNVSSLGLGRLVFVKLRYHSG